MKPTFRESADRQLSAITFTDDMKLQVLVQARRRQRSRRTVYATAACACAAFAGAFLLFGRTAAPDSVLPPALPAIMEFSSRNAEIAINSCEWEGYYLNIGYTVSANTDSSIQFTSYPFSSAENAFVETENGVPLSPDTKKSLTISPGESVELTANLRIDECRPGNVAELRLDTDIYVSDSASTERINVIIPAEIPENLRKGTYIRPGETAANGLFSVKINKGYFAPDETQLIMTITSQRSLRRKTSCEFSIRLTNETGELSVDYPLKASMVSEDENTGERLYSFSRTLGFAPAEIKIICEWSDENSHGTAEAVFASSAN